MIRLDDIAFYDVTWATVGWQLMCAIVLLVVLAVSRWRSW